MTKWRSIRWKVLLELLAARIVELLGFLGEYVFSMLCRLDGLIGEVEVNTAFSSAEKQVLWVSFVDTKYSSGHTYSTL